MEDVVGRCESARELAGIALRRRMTCRSRETVDGSTRLRRFERSSRRSTLIAPPAVPADADGFDPDRILAILDAHRLEYLLVGGLAARAYGAERRTADVDCVPSTTMENLERVAAALRELGARLRVGGMTDEEAKQLPVQLEAATLTPSVVNR